MIPRTCRAARSGSLVGDTTSVLKASARALEDAASTLAVSSSVLVDAKRALAASPSVLVDASKAFAASFCVFTATTRGLAASPSVLVDATRTHAASFSVLVNASRGLVASPSVLADAPRPLAAFTSVGAASLLRRHASARQRLDAKRLARDEIRVNGDTFAGDRPDTTRLRADLEAALVRELAGVYRDLNASLFGRKLGGATLALTDGTAYLGRYLASEHRIEIARALVLGRPWGVVVEVLKHEMAHQFVHEVLRVEGETAHGPAFRELCGRLGIDATAAGMPDANAKSAEDASVLERISRLLALAESSNVHEAQAAMNAAQRLMLKHNLESVAAQRKAGYSFRHLGAPTGRVSEAERLLGTILGKHFFVEVIWVPAYRPLEGKHGSVLEVCGTPANLEMAAYVHAFLTHAADRLWREHKRARSIRRDRDRRTYLAGVMVGFLEKLNDQRTTHTEQGLVWVGDAELDGFFRRRHPRIVHVRHAGNRRTAAHADGRQAGRNIVLHRPVGSGPSGGVKLLGRG